MNLLDQLAFIFGDPQVDAAPGWDRINPATGRSTRFDETIALLRRTAREAFDAGARIMIMLGDATEYKNPGSLELKALAEIFADWIAWGGVVYVLAGNHDGNQYDVTSSSLEPLAKMRPDAFHLYHEITFVEELNALMVPYIHRMSPADIGAAMFLEMPETVSGPVVAFTHFGNLGAKCGAKEQVAPGDYLGPDQFKDIIGLDHVFGGHIHQHGEGFFTMPDGRRVPWGHPGSTTVQAMDERNDKKGYYLLHLRTRERVFHEIQQPRRWISIEWKDIRWPVEVPAIGEGQEGQLAEPIPEPSPLWGKDDIVRFTGICPRGIFPVAVLEELFKSNVLPRPWVYDAREVRPLAEARVARDTEITRSGGIRQALITMVRNTYPSDKDGEQGIIAEATDAALSVLRDQAGAVTCSVLWPESLEIDGHRTFKRRHFHKFELGTPLCITAESGAGKSNFFDALFFNITGRSFKNPSMGSVVPRELDKGRTVGIYAGTTPLGPERFRITREVSSKKDGSASQKLTIERWNPETEAWDGSKLNDGGIPERQARIDTLFGGSWLGLRTTNFGIQRDRDTFLLSKQSERKAVLLDAIGLASLLAAHRILDKRRTEASDAAKAARSELAGLLAGTTGAGDRLLALRGQIQADESASQTSLAQIVLEEAELAKSEGILESAKAAVQEAEGRFAALPNSGAAYQVALAARDSREKEHARERLQKLDEYKSAAAALDSLNAELQALGEAADLEALKDAVDKLEGVEAENAKRLSALMQSASNARAAVESAIHDLARLQQEKSAHAGKDIGTCSKCQQAINTQQLEEELKRIESDIKTTGEERARRGDAAKAAETSQKELESEIATHRTLLATARKSLEDARLAAQKRDSIAGRLRPAQEKIDEIRAIGVKHKEDFALELTTLSSAVDAAAAEALRTEQQAQAIRLELQGLREKVSTGIEAVAGIRARITALRQAVADADRRCQEALQQIARLDDLLTKVLEAEGKLPGLERKARVAEIAASLIDPRSGLPNYLIDEAVPALEEYINGYLSQLRSDGLRVKIQSPPDKPDDLEILVDNGRPGRLLDVLDYSGGQQESLEIASKLAVADIKTQFRDVTFGMRFYDEPITGLDAFGKAAFLRIVNDQMATYPVTAITSHDPEIVRAFSYRLNFEGGPEAETILTSAA